MLIDGHWPLNCSFEVNGIMISPELQFYCRQTVKVISAVNSIRVKIQRHVQERLTDVYDLVSISPLSSF